MFVPSPMHAGHGTRIEDNPLADPVGFFRDSNSAVGQALQHKFGALVIWETLASGMSFLGILCIYPQKRDNVMAAASIAVACHSTSLLKMLC